MIDLSQFNTIANKHQTVLASFSEHLEPIRQAQDKAQRAMQPVQDLSNKISEVQNKVLSAYPFTVGDIRLKPSIDQPHSRKF